MIEKPKEHNMLQVTVFLVEAVVKVVLALVARAVLPQNVLVASDFYKT